MAERVFVAGHRGLVGSALVRALYSKRSTILTASRSELDLRDRQAVSRWMNNNKPEVVILAAARVGGIGANIADPTGFLVDNLEIQNAVMLSAVEAGVNTTVFLGSSCIYPRDAAQPMSESQLMSGPLEPTNESYAVAKIAGMQLAKSLHTQYGILHVNPLPCNVYGPGDHFEFERSHVVSALVRRFVDATNNNLPKVTLWGTGSARREFIHCDDLADAILFLMDRRIGPDPVNVGTGEDISIRELAELIAKLTGYQGELDFDTSKPDGMPRKLLNVDRLNGLGWRNSRKLEIGLQDVISDYQNMHLQR